MASDLIKCNILKYPSEENWLEIRNDFLFTKKKSSDIIPPEKLRVKYLASGHSPIYNLIYKWEWVNLPYWVAMHFKSHHLGIHQVTSTQRNDLQKDYNRKKAPQDSPVNHRCTANAAAIINISQKRLCLTASSETRKAWELFLFELEKVSPEIVKLCVKPCVSKNGLCPEVFSDCRWNHTAQFKKEIEQYKTYFKT